MCGAELGEPPQSAFVQEQYFRTRSTMPSFRRHGKSDNLTLCAVASMVMLTGLLVYMAMLLSPPLFRGIIRDVVCDERQLYVGGLNAQQSTLQSQGSLIAAGINRTHVIVAVDEHGHTHVSIQASQVSVGCDSTASSSALQVAGLPRTSLLAQAGASKSFSVMIGVFSTAPKAERRNLLRLAYGIQDSEYADVTIKFVVGKVKTSDDKILLGLEMLYHDDILLLNSEESINGGKTFDFFSTVAGQSKKYDYVMKADDDSYVRFDNLGRSLHRLPRTELYYGYVLPCENNDPYAWYMAGMGYLVSWDLVQWIRESPIPRDNSVGTEDQLMGDWFNEGKKATNRVNKKPLFYDHPDFGGQCAHALIPETILVHQLKNQDRWINVLSYFEEHRMRDMFPGTQESQSPS